MRQEIERAEVGHRQAMQGLDGVFFPDIDIETAQLAAAVDFNRDVGTGWNGRRRIE